MDPESDAESFRNVRKWRLRAQSGAEVDRGRGSAADEAGGDDAGEFWRGDGDHQRVWPNGSDGWVHALRVRGSRGQGRGLDRAWDQQRAGLRAGRAAGVSL